MDAIVLDESLLDKLGTWLVCDKLQKYVLPATDILGMGITGDIY